MKSTHLVSMIIAATLPASALLAQEEHGKMGDMMKGDHTQMAEMHQKMEAEMKAQNAELDKFVAAMNNATGEKKADAMAALISKIVEQRKTMHEKMSGMHMDMNAAMDCCKEGMKKEMMRGKAQSSATPGT